MHSSAIGGTEEVSGPGFEGSFPLKSAHCSMYMLVQERYTIMFVQCIVMRRLGSSI